MELDVTSSFEERTIQATSKMEREVVMGYLESPTETRMRVNLLRICLRAKEHGSFLETNTKGNLKMENVMDKEIKHGPWV